MLPVSDRSPVIRPTPRLVLNPRRIVLEPRHRHRGAARQIETLPAFARYNNHTAWRVRPPHRGVSDDSLVACRLHGWPHFHRRRRRPEARDRCRHESPRSRNSQRSMASRSGSTPCAGKAATVVVFVSFECPVSNSYADPSERPGQKPTPRRAWRSSSSARPTSRRDRGEGGRGVQAERCPLCSTLRRNSPPGCKARRHTGGVRPRWRRRGALPRADRRRLLRAAEAEPHGHVARPDRRARRGAGRQAGGEGRDARRRLRDRLDDRRRRQAGAVTFYKDVAADPERRTAWSATGTARSGRSR